MTLAALARATSDTGPGRSQGLTVVESRLGYTSEVHSQKENGRLCVWMEAVGVDLTPASVEIIIPSEYPEGSCEYDAILLHEREHERVYQERVAAAVAEIRGALISAKWLPARGNPVEAADQASAEVALNAKIHKVVDPAYANYKEELGAAQAELDKPALYQWVSKRCSGWK